MKMIMEDLGGWVKKRRWSIMSFLLPVMLLILIGGYRTISIWRENVISLGYGLAVCLFFFLFT